MQSIVCVPRQDRSALGNKVDVDTKLVAVVFVELSNKSSIVTFSIYHVNEGAGFPFDVQVNVSSANTKVVCSGGPELITIENII